MMRMLAMNLMLTAICTALVALTGCGDSGGVSAEEPSGDPDSSPETSNDASGFENENRVIYPDESPPEFADRPRSPSCGSEGVGSTESTDFVETIPDFEARSCLLDAWSSGEEAELSTALPTVEGPILVVLRVLATGEVERYEFDPLGRGSVVQTCDALEVEGERVPPETDPPSTTPTRLDAAACGPVAEVRPGS